MSDSKHPFAPTPRKEGRGPNDQYHINLDLLPWEVPRLAERCYDLGLNVPDVSHEGVTAASLKYADSFTKRWESTDVMGRPNSSDPVTYEEVDALRRGEANESELFVRIANQEPDLKAAYAFSTTHGMGTELVLVDLEHMPGVAGEAPEKKLLYHKEVAASVEMWVLSTVGPHSHLAAHPVYGSEEVYRLARRVIFKAYLLKEDVLGVIDDILV